MDLSTEREHWPVVVVGAGPAGTAAAIASARLGLRVLLVDAKSFPRRKVCGGCMNCVSVGLAKQLLGEDHAVWNSTRSLGSFVLTHAGRSFTLAMPGGCAVDRAALDDALAQQAVAEGVTFLPATTAQLKHLVEDARLVILNSAGQTREILAGVVVVAAGLANRAVGGDDQLKHMASSHSRVGVEAIFSNYPKAYHAGAIHMVVGREGYVGLTRVDGDRLHVAAAVDREPLQRLGPPNLIQTILSANGAAELYHDPTASWRGTPPLTARPSRLAAERVFLVGDAGGYVEPFTGEGIRWALESGLGVAPFAAWAVNGGQTDLPRRWEAWYRQRIRPEQQLCRRLSTGLRRAPLRWLALQLLRWQPNVATSIIARLNRESSP